MSENSMETRRPARRLVGKDQYASLTLAGLLVVGASFGALGLWSATAPISAAAIAPGALVVESNRKSVAHLEGGIVREILVRDGEAVEAGQVLMHFDATQMQASLKLLEGRYASARALESRLTAEREGRTHVQFPADLQEMAVRDPELAESVDGQRRIFEARRASLTSQVSILENRIEQSKSQIAGLQQQEASKIRQLQLFNTELQGLKQLFEKGVASGKQVSALEREMARVAGERGEVVARLSEVRQAIGEAQLQIFQIRKSFSESVATELREAQAQVFETMERLNVVRESLGRLAVRAPVAGTVVDLAIHTAGGVAQPGARLLDIVPKQDELVVEARVSPGDIEGVNEGLTADLRFVGFRRGTTPVVHGTVRMVSADRLVNPRTEQPYYIVRIDVGEEGREKLKDYRLVPGLPVEAIINKEERTLFQYFAQPFQDAMARAFRG
ncbi:MAG: HlyD family type I secretion periplasmic adaptor subunit [Alphaproteobacteria bacterium]|nr:HlyD family type I secretion periplasmic adaptor subunit [Alphaproteobacteria bacterium]